MPTIVTPHASHTEPPSPAVVFSHKLVKEAQESLVSVLETYLDSTDVQAIIEACVFADQAHILDKRKSGEPYITHPIAVAEILANFRLDSDTLIAALLHDTVEDTNITEDDIREHFGDTVALLVDGVTKLKISTDKQLNKAATFRKILTATLSDERVLIIKLADRLHNLSTMSAVREDKRMRTAQETLDFYLPFARVLGLNALADELELLCLKNLDEAQFDYFNTQLDSRKLARSHRQHQIKNYFYHKLEQLGMSGYVTIDDNRNALCRTFFANKTELNALLTRYHFTVVLDKVTDCDELTHYLANRYNIDKDNIDDHIRKPHAGGLQALYLRYALDNETIDLTIQTKTMRKVARLGVMLGDSAPAASRATLQASLKNLQELVNPTCAKSTTRALLDYLNQDKVVAISPEGDIFELPIGATVLDFAYAASPFLGNHAISATLDGKPANLASKVTSGQKVHIITDPLSAPNAEWLSFVVTTKARQNLQKWLKTQAIPEQIQGGKDALSRALKAHEKSLEGLDDAAWQSLFDWQHTHSKDDIYQRIATGALLPQLVVSHLFSVQNNAQAAACIGQKPSQSKPADRPAVKTDTQTSQPRAQSNTPQPNAKRSTNKPAEPCNHSTLPQVPKGNTHRKELIRNTQGIELHFAGCCNPIQGDPIAGHLTRQGMVVHRHRCFNIQQALNTEPQQVLGLAWEDTKPSDSYFSVLLSIQTHMDEDTISQVILELRKLNVGVNDIYSSDNQTLAYLIVEDRNHVAKTIRALRAKLGYPSVRRLYQFS